MIAVVKIARLSDGPDEILAHRLAWRGSGYRLSKSIRPSVDVAAAIVCEGEVVAWVGLVEASERMETPTYYGAGTWVGESHRRQGLATQL